MYKSKNSCKSKLIGGGADFASILQKVSYILSSTIRNI